MSCPICRATGSTPIFTLNDVPAHVAAVYRTPEEARNGARGDLRLVVCAACGHVWNEANDPTLTDYSGEYNASLHHSPAYARFLAETARRLVGRWPLAGRLAVEPGCGDGTFLRLLADLAECDGLGIDPSAPDVPEASGVTLRRERFGGVHADALRERDVALVVCRQMLHYIATPVPFVRQMAAVGAPVYAEVPNGAWVFREAVPWTIFYEHVHYFAPSSLSRAFAEAGYACHVAPVFREDQYLAAYSSRGPSEPLAPEAAHLDAVRTFGARAQVIVGYWRVRVIGWANAGESVVVWGAAGRGTTFVAAMPEGSIAAVADNNPARQGGFLAGTGLPILAPEALVALAPDRIVLTNTTYAPEILTQIAELGLTATVEVV